MKHRQTKDVPTIIGREHLYMEIESKLAHRYEMYEALSPQIPESAVTLSTSW